MLISLLSFAFANPSLVIQHDIQGSYLHNEPIVITYTIHNQGQTDVSLPDLAYQTWRSSFVLEQQGKKETRRNEPKDKTPLWTIPPQGRRIFRLEIPGGSTLKKGEYDLTIELNYEIDVFREKYPLSIRAPLQAHVDIYKTLGGEVSSLWTDQATNNTYYNVGSEQITVHPFVGAPKQILNNHEGVFDYHQENQRLTIHGKRKYSLVIPYNDAQLLGRMSLYQQEFLFPLWRPSEKILMLVQLDERGIPLYRKVRHNMPEPIFVDTTLNSLDIPLYLIHHDGGVELLQAQPPQSPSIPLNSQYIHKNKTEQKVLIARFALHPSEGLCVYLIRQDSERTQEMWIHLSGTLISQQDIPAIEAPILDVYPSEQALLLQENDTLVVVHSNNKIPLHEKDCTLNKHVVVCFTQGKWIRPYTYR